MRVVPMRTKGGNSANNQNKVIDEEGVHFFSYGSKIASYNPWEITGSSHMKNIVTLYEPYWNMYSQTTNYYLLQFLEEDSIKDIRKKVISGDYLVA
jgi:hypothetical protein